MCQQRRGVARARCAHSVPGQAASRATTTAAGTALSSPVRLMTARQNTPRVQKNNNTILPFAKINTKIISSVQTCGADRAQKSVRVLFTAKRVAFFNSVKKIKSCCSERGVKSQTVFSCSVPALQGEEGGGTNRRRGDF